MDTKSMAPAEGTLNEKTVLPWSLLTAKSPLPITSMPMSTSQELSMPLVTRTSGDATRFGRKRLTR